MRLIIERSIGGIHVATHTLAGAALLLCTADAAEVTGWLAYRLPLLDESGFPPDYLGAARRQPSPKRC
jgi:hypothetical protein